MYLARLKSDSLSWFPLYGLVALALSMGVGRFAITPILPATIEEGWLTLAQSGWMASIHFIGYWLGSVTADARWVKRLITPNKGLMIIVAGTLAMALPFVGLWWGARFVLGIVSAWVFIQVIYQAQQSDQSAARSRWTFVGIGCGISAVGAMVMVALQAGLSVQVTWLLIAIMAISAMLAVQSPRYRAQPSGSNSNLTAGVLQRNGKPLAWRLVLAYGVSGLAYIIPATYLPALASQHFSEPALFGWCWVLFGLAAGGSVLLAHKLELVMTCRQIWALGHVLMSAGLLAPVFSSSLLAYLISGLCVGATFVVVTLYALRIAGQLGGADSYRWVAAFTAAFAAGQVLGPFISAAVIEFFGGLDAVMIGAAILLLLGAAQVLFYQTSQE